MEQKDIELIAGVLKRLILSEYQKRYYKLKEDMEKYKKESIIKASASFNMDNKDLENELDKLDLQDKDD